MKKKIVILTATNCEDNIIFSCLNNNPMYGYTYHVLFSHSFVGRYFGCFHLLAIMKNAAMNVHVAFCVAIYFHFSCKYILRSGIGRSYVKLYLTF